jgi:hypothetical protein
MLPGVGSVQAGFGFLPETARILDKMQVAPTIERARICDNLVRGLIADGLWAKLDMLYLTKAHDAQAARVNWVNPSSVASETNSLTFTTDVGYAGNGTDSYLNTGVNWQALSLYAQDDCHIGVWVVGGTDEASDTTTSLVGHAGSGNTNNIVVRSVTGGNLRGRLNSSSISTFGVAGTILGYSLITRRGATELEGYKNNASLGTDNDASTGDTSVNVALFRHNTNFSNKQAAAFHLGSGFSDTDAANMYARLNTFISAF